MKYKKIISVILAVILPTVSFFTSMNTSYAESNQETTDDLADGNTMDTGEYENGNYRVTFVMDSTWENGYNATITIQNKGNTTIENWCIAFPLKQKISNIWNASIVETYDDYYVIKNAEWNQDIYADASVSFGITVYEPFVSYPEYYTMLGNEIIVNDSDYSISYKITEDWGTGFHAQILIENTGNQTLEDWRLQFQSDFTITDLWNGVVITKENSTYLIGGDVPNQNILPDTSVEIGFTVMSGSSSSIPSCFHLTEYSAPGSTVSMPEGFFSLAGYVEEDSDELVLTWYSNQSYENYEVFSSLDGDNFESISERFRAWEYTYDMSGMPNKLYLCVKGYYGDKEDTSDMICVEKQDNKYLITNKDTDEDGLCDCYEYILGTDINRTDSDGDGLTDYQEAFMFLTNPAMIDTDENGINDGDEDFDFDNLSNLEELEAGTNPLLYDTDEDGLGDGDEQNIYFTNPLCADTDGEGLLDGAEIGLSLNPLKPDTDDNGILDCDELIEQTYMYAINDSEKPEVTSVSLTLSCTGFLDDMAYIENMYHVDMLSSEVVGLVGVPVEIAADVEFEQAEIMFTYDEAALGDTPEENLRVMWYDEANDTYVLFDEETILDTENNTVSYVTEHFSTYMLVDREIWFDTLRQDVNYRESGDMVYYDIMFTVDVSGSMKGNRISLAKTALNTYIDAMEAWDFAGIVKFNSSAQVVQRLNEDRSTLKRKVNQLSASGGTNAVSGLWLSAKELAASTSNNDRMIILICDGDVKVDQALIAYAIEHEITIHCVNVASGTAQAMENIAYATGGCYYYAATTDDLLQVMEKLQDDTIDYMDMTDSDGDGLYDVYEVNGMRLSNGTVVYTNPQSADSDGDGISDYDELGGVPVEEAIYIDGNLYSCTFNHMRSNPGMQDSDGDGIPDIVDDRPNCKDIIEVVALKNDAYVPIEKDGEVFYGGKQGWWKDEDTLLSASGCGLIAMSDTQLYLTLNYSKYSLDTENTVEVNTNGVCSFESYHDYVNELYADKYPVGTVEVSVMPIIPSMPQIYINTGVFYKDMEIGLEEFYEFNGEKKNVVWAPAHDSSEATVMLCQMLDSDIPVPASYYAPFSKFYFCYLDYNEWKMVETSTFMREHYFNITGYYKLYENGKYVTYLQISSGGKKFYISYDKWIKKLSSFTNILYTTY